LSRIKGGRLAQAFRGRALFSLIISDVIGDPLDVIASGPTAADPTTFADALAVLHRYDLLSNRGPNTKVARVPASVVHYLQEGAAGRKGGTPKPLPAPSTNEVRGKNVQGLAAAQGRGGGLGYRVLNRGAYIEGETREGATALAGLVGSVRADAKPLPPPLC